MVDLAPLTPLRTPRSFDADRAEYGHPWRTTDCGRFDLERWPAEGLVPPGWMIVAHPIPLVPDEHPSVATRLAWQHWLVAVGLASPETPSTVRFARRHEALRALHDALAQAKLLAATIPPMA